VSGRVIVGGLLATGLAAIVAGCTPAPRHDLASVVAPSEIASLMCLENRSGNEAGCKEVRLPDPASAMAYGMCLEYHRLDVKACRDLRAAYEAELRAYLALPGRAPNSPAGAANAPQIPAQRARELHKTAEALYKATSTDAQTFEAALLIPDIRQKIAAVLRQNLSDEKLRTLATQARAEALYWYAYMQGLERAQNTY
jgi:hypothetical protein